MRWQLVLGSESFARRVQDRLRRKSEAEREQTSLRQARRVIEPGRVVKLVANAFGVEGKRLRARGEYGSIARNVAIWLVWENCGMTLREVGEYFGGIKDQAVAQRLRRLGIALPKITRKLQNEISKI